MTYIIPLLALASSLLQQDKQQLLQLHKAMYEAIALKKEAPLQQTLQHEFVFTDAFGVVWNKEGFINGFALNKAITLPVFETHHENITIIDNTAICTAEAVIHIKKGDQPVQELRELVTETWVKQRERWQLLALQATFVQKK